MSGGRGQPQARETGRGGWHSKAQTHLAPSCPGLATVRLYQDMWKPQSVLRLGKNSRRGDTKDVTL